MHCFERNTIIRKIEQDILSLCIWFPNQTLVKMYLHTVTMDIKRKNKIIIKMQIKTRLIAVNDGNSKLKCNMLSLLNLLRRQIISTWI